MGYYRSITGWSIYCKLDDSSIRKPYKATVFYAGAYTHTDTKKKDLKFYDEAEARFATEEEARRWIEETCQTEIKSR